MRVDSRTNVLVSVVVPVRADFRITKLLESLSNQTAPRSSYEILVIENGSSGCREIANNFGARYFSMPSGNLCAARNVGLRESAGEYILATDSDCVVARNWI